jgi:hypothetical protein
MEVQEEKLVHCDNTQEETTEVAKEAEPLADCVYKYNQSKMMEEVEVMSIDYENMQDTERWKGGLVERSIDYNCKPYPLMNLETLEVRSIDSSDTSILLMKAEEEEVTLINYHRI